MAGDKIRIVATDGDDTVTLGFISCGKDYVFGQVTPKGMDEPHHYTYHKNGYMHLKLQPGSPSPDNMPQYYGPPLNNFRGFVSTGMTGISREVGKILSPDYTDDERGYDNVTYIDTRNTEYGMTYQRFICEAGFPVGKLIQSVKSSLPLDRDMSPRLSYQIYTDTEPWVGVASWQSASGIGGFGATNNFRPMGTSVGSKRRKDPYPEPCPSGDLGCDGPDGIGPLCMECYNCLKSCK